jgi:hypothetical protein
MFKGLLESFIVIIVLFVLLVVAQASKAADVYVGINTGGTLDLSSVTVGIEARHIGAQVSVGLSDDDYDYHKDGYYWHPANADSKYNGTPVGGALTYKFDSGIVLGAGAMYTERYNHHYWDGRPSSEVLPDASVGYRKIFGNRFTFAGEYSLARGIGVSAGLAF